MVSNTHSCNYFLRSLWFCASSAEWGPEQIADTLRSWNEAIGSYIATVASDAARMKFPGCINIPLMDVVEDRVDHNGSGARAAVHAMSSNIFNPSAAISILARLNSDRGSTDSARTQGVAATPPKLLTSDQAHGAFVDAISALYQDAFRHLGETASRSGNSFNAAAVWNIWRGATIASAFHAALVDDPIESRSATISDEWRAVVAAAATENIGIPMLSALFNFVVAQNSPYSYASVLQLMRHQLGGSRYLLVSDWR
ncbi:hypothetical protein [Saccharopolyspora gloriosae]|uniref:hypothetical protein n=1 Tax=Saccharopolyspora gloriosae TaxID=455344 RepID=UPI00215F267F|nr:hypothetical protein [Saccharopolyspora gloriosae]